MYKIANKRVPTFSLLVVIGWGLKPSQTDDSYVILCFRVWHFEH